jgi:hypothetical protein
MSDNNFLRDILAKYEAQQLRPGGKSPSSFQPAPIKSTSSTTPPLFLHKALSAPNKNTATPLFYKRRKTFVSFDWENDRRYKHALQMFDANKKFDFRFKDASSGEINTNDVGRVKAALTIKIDAATHFLCIAGAYANELHKDHRLIGEINWLNFEARQAVAAKKKIVIVRLHPSNKFPYALEGVRGILVDGFKPAAIQQALIEVR